MGFREFVGECMSIHHGVRAAQEWTEQNGGSDFEVSVSTLASLAAETGSDDMEKFREGWDSAMEHEASKEEARQQGGLRGFLFG